MIELGENVVVKYIQILRSGKLPNLLGWIEEEEGTKVEGKNCRKLTTKLGWAVSGPDQ
jgi:hypothetical protein